MMRKLLAISFAALVALGSIAPAANAGFVLPGNEDCICLPGVD
jgi:hypothetical protein